jgi:hypothetical protein
MHSNGSWFARHSFWVIVSLALCLYLPLLSRNYDPNGLTEAEALQAGHAVNLFDPNHLLYRPIGSLVRQGLSLIGIVLSPLNLLQILSAVFGAIGIGFVYLSVRELTSNRTIAMWASALLAVSWSYWTLSTDVYYFSMAAMLLAAAFYFFVRSDSSWSFAVCGVLAGASILACQANVFVLPGFGAALLVRESRPRLRIAVQRMLLIWIPAIAVVGITFLSAGVLVYGQRTADGLYRWATQYSGKTLPMWGSWAPARFLAVTGSAFRSVLGWDLWMFGFFQRHLHNGQLPGWVAPLGFAFLASGLIAAFHWSTSKGRDQDRMILSLLLLYLIYAPFIIWWEAAEPRWFIMPNIFLVALAAVIASRWTQWRFLPYALAATLIVLGSVNLALSIWPKHFRTSIPAQMAACVAGHMDQHDLFLATEWNWAPYLPFVHNREMLSFIGEVSRTGDKTLAIRSINEHIVERQRQGGRVFMIDFRSYPQEYMQWLRDQTKLTESDLTVYSGERTFECVYSRFYELDPWTGPASVKTTGN